MKDSYNSRFWRELDLYLSFTLTIFFFQLQNENLSLKLQEEMSNRDEVLQKSVSFLYM